MMLPPYDTEEVARAVAEDARARVEPPTAVSVLAHVPGRRWTVVACFPARGHVRVEMPFSTEEGILTPAELAQGLLTRLATP